MEGGGRRYESSSMTVDMTPTDLKLDFRRIQSGNRLLRRECGCDAPRLPRRLLRC
jgi:hypothetical protein